MVKQEYRLTINEKFSHVAPPLKGNEFRLLEQDIMERGCIDPILVWKGMIVDGHNRYRICRNHRIPFAVQEMDFEDESEAVLWIARNQLARRNLTAFQKCEMVLPLERALKEEAEKRRRRAISRYRSTGETGNEPAMKTRDILSGMAGVSHGTLQRVKKILVYGDEETKRRIRDGEISIGYAYKTLFSTPNKPDSRPKRNWLSELEIAVRELTKKVEDGEASQKEMLSDLAGISAIIDANGGRG